ncbi:MAG: histidine triad nucleotide-binding protein [Patescibacteria group bacterium]
MDCIFCKITKKETPSDIVYEDGELMVFKDINPKAPVHLLVVPKKHIVSVNELEDDDADLAGQLIIQARNAAKSFGLAGYKLVFNVGRNGGQIVDHIHLHILGGWADGQDPNKVKIWPTKILKSK